MAQTVQKNPVAQLKNRFSNLTPQRVVLGFLSLVTVFFVVFGYPGTQNLEMKQFRYVLSPGERIQEIPQKDQPDQFIVKFRRRDLASQGSPIFQSAPAFQSTYSLNITSNGQNELTFFSSGLGGRSDFIVSASLDAGCDEIEIVVLRHFDRSGNNIELSCNGKLVQSFDSPTFIFTRVQAGITIEYHQFVSHLHGNLKIASTFHALTLFSWVGMAFWLFPNATNRKVNFFRLRNLNLTWAMIALGVLGLATVTMPGLVDDGSVLSIVKNFRSSSGSTNNIFSASAHEWPVGTGAIALLNVVIGRNPSAILTRLPIFATFAFSLYLLSLTFARVRSHADNGPTAPLILFASFTSILVGWGVTLRLEFLLVPMACLLLYLAINFHTQAIELSRQRCEPDQVVLNEVAFVGGHIVRGVLAIAFLGGLAVSVTQAGVAILVAGGVAAYQILQLISRWRISIIASLFISSLLGFLSGQPWLSVPQFLELASNFQAANGSVHSTTILDEIDRYSATVGESTLRIFGVYLLLFGLISAIVLIASRKSKQSFFIGSIVFSAYLGLAFTSSRWQWHLVVLAPFTALSLQITWNHIRNRDQNKSAPLTPPQIKNIRARIAALMSRSRRQWPTFAFTFALTYLALSSLSSVVQPLFGSTPNLRNTEALTSMQSRVTKVLGPAIGPVPSVLLVFGLLLFVLGGVSGRLFHFAGNTSLALPFVTVFVLSFFPLIPNLLNEESPSHMGLPLFELREREDCGWLSKFSEFSLPPPSNQANGAELLPSQITALRKEIKNLEWVSQDNFAVDLAEGHRLLIRNSVGEFGRIEIESYGIFEFPSQSYIEVRILEPSPEARTLSVVASGVQLSVVNSTGWESTDINQIVRETNGLTDPVLHPLTPCVSTQVNNGLFWNEFVWTLSNPSITDLGQSAPLDIGLRFASEFGVIRVSCPVFNELTDVNQCLYIYLDS